MQNKKLTLNVIIILLIVFVPLAIISTILHIQFGEPIIDNPNHEFQYNGKLYFYNNNELLGIYTCQSNDYCDYGISKVNSSYGLLEHQEEQTTKLTLIDNRYAFLIDTTITSLSNPEIILFDLETNKELGRYAEVKNYGIGINNNNYIVKNTEGLWGVLEFYDGVNLKIPFMYDYIGLADQIDSTTNLISSDAFAVLKDNVWYLIDINNTKLTDSYRSNIVTYNNEYVVTSSGSAMQLLTYDSRNRLFGSYKYINFCSKYIAIVDNTNIFYLYDLNANQEVGNRHHVQNPNDLSFEIANDRVYVRMGEELIENVAIK